MSYFAKSAIFDCKNIWTAGGYYLYLRSIDFFLDETQIILTAANITCYATSYFNSSYVPQNAFISSLSKVGSYVKTSWIAASGQLTNQRLICVFDDEIEFNRVVINNGHYMGSPQGGVKDFKFSISSDAISDIVYDNDISNGTVLYEGQLAEHIAEDIADPQELPLIFSKISGTIIPNAATDVITIYAYKRMTKSLLASKTLAAGASSFSLTLQGDATELFLIASSESAEGVLTYKILDTINSVRVD